MFLPKKFEDNKVALPNVSKVVAIGKIKSRQSGYKSLQPEVKFQSVIYPSWSNTYDQHLKGLTLKLLRTQKYFCQRSLKITKLSYQMCQKQWQLGRSN